MNQVITEVDIKRMVENSEELKRYLHKSFKIQILSESNNVVFKILGKNNLVAKVGYTGYGKNEYNTLKILSSKNYNVPNPIAYIPVHKELANDWSYGDINRELGVLFFLLLEGKNLKQDLTKINIIRGLNFLKNLHEDRSLTVGKIKDYQQVEVERGLKYTKKLLNGELSKSIQKIIKKYRNYEIDYRFIHGGPRLEHFIVKDNKIWMIDFEGACLGDRFKDLGIYFTEIILHNFNKSELIKAYFDRKLNDDEVERLMFFELRALLVKMNFEPSPEVLKHIKELVKYS